MRTTPPTNSLDNTPASFEAATTRRYSNHCRRMPEARVKSKLPIEIVVENDVRHQTSVRKPRIHPSPSGLNIEHQCRRGP